MLVNLVMPEINEVHNVVVLEGEREREKRTSSKKEEAITQQYRDHSTFRKWKVRQGTRKERLETRSEFTPSLSSLLL